MIYTLSNDLLTVQINTHGAELSSIRSNSTGQQYLYQGDTPFWGRRSPILFPIVGSVWQNHITIDGTRYPMSQHGFARDSDFTPVPDTPENEAWFRLDSDSNTLAVYPRRFTLLIGYRLQGERITVMWSVTNLDSSDMPFQIGAHPAFLYPDFNPADPVHAYLHFNRPPHTTQLIKEAGCIGPDEAPVSLDTHQMLPVTAHTFNINTIILAHSQVQRVSMLDKNRTPYLTLLFSAPVTGIWSPSPQAPFMCIEPWYGRADRTGYTGEFSCREYTNNLPPHQTFTATYTIIIDNL